MTARKRTRASAEKDQATRDKEIAESEQSGSAFERPEQGEEDYAESTGINTTDAEGFDSRTQPGAAEGIDPTRATPHLAPNVTDPNYAREAAKRAMKAKYGDDIPYMLHGALDVRRGDQIVRIPHGTVVSDLELSEEDFDSAIDNDIIREATVAEFRAQQAKEAAAESAKRVREHKKQMIGQKPKKASDKVPAGATVVADLSASAIENDQIARNLSARSSAQSAAGRRKAE